MAIDFFDSNMFLGRPVKAIYRPAATVDELLAEMDSAGIARALVWHIAQQEVSPAEGNRLVSEMIAGYERLLGCWTILPPQTGEVIDDGFFERMKAGGAVALRAFPNPHNYLLNRTVFGGFLDEVTARRIPLLLSLEHGTTWPQVYELMSQYPNLTCIVCEIGIWGQDRRTWPLLETYPNLYVETSLLSLEAGGIEAGVGKFGAGRFAFGSGFPRTYPEAAILELTHAGISDEDRRRIASTNLEEILSGVKL